MKEIFNGAECGERLRKLRQENNLTQEAVAAELNLGDYHTYLPVEKGNRRLKDGEIVILAELFNTTTDYILRGKDTDNIDICKSTGLSNQAVNVLKDLVNAPTASPRTRLVEIADNCIENAIAPDEIPPTEIISALNLILTSREGIKILSLLYRYLHADFTKASYDGNTVRYLMFENIPTSPKGETVISLDFMKFAIIHAIEKEIDRWRDNVSGKEIK